MQTMAEQLGGAVEASPVSEFGYAQITQVGRGRLLHDIYDHAAQDGSAPAGCVDESWR